MENTSARSLGYATLPAAYFTAGSSSFTDFLTQAAPELVPGRSVSPTQGQVDVPHGTTIVALTCRGGVVIAGDRRSTQGNLIAQRDVEKVLVVDDHSAVGVAGTAVAFEMVRLFSVELQHYEKLEGVSLTFDGKANKLASMVRGNLGAAMQGLVAVPLFAGFDTDAEDPDRAGRIVSFDIAGGRADESLGFHSIGSGSLFARSALKKLHDPDAEPDAAVRTAVEALYDAADDDTATGTPDMNRRIYPTVVTVTGARGAVLLPEEQTGTVVEAVVAGRRERPGG